MLPATLQKLKEWANKKTGSEQFPGVELSGSLWDGKVILAREILKMEGFEEEKENETHPRI